MSHPQPELPEFLASQRRLTPGETFAFTCHPGVPCFNTCCADVNIILAPLDVVRLARRLGMTTRDFLDSYTGNPVTKDLRLPVVLLKMRDEPAKRCHFLGEDGCTVYADRPWACRMYPLGMALPPARAGEEPEPVFFIFEDEFCQGRHQPDRCTFSVDAWRQDQALIEQDELEIGFRELVGHPWFIGGRILDPKRMHMFYTACYDLDSFREFVFESTFLDRFEVSSDLQERLRTDDASLLRFAFRWLRFALFGESTMTVREGHDPQGRHS